VKKYFMQLRPLERRLAVGVLVVLFLALNYVFVWPHFSDFGKLRQRAEGFCFCGGHCGGSFIGVHNTWSIREAAVASRISRALTAADFGDAGGSREENCLRNRIEKMAFSSVACPPDAKPALPVPPVTPWTKTG